MKGEAEMKKYIKPEMEIDIFEAEDVITTSPVSTNEDVGGGDPSDF